MRWKWNCEERDIGCGWLETEEPRSWWVGSSGVDASE